VYVVVLAIAFDFIKIIAVRITLSRTARLQQLPQLFDRTWPVFSRVFDLRPIFDLNHFTSDTF
jgi:hypothetical protein